MISRVEVGFLNGSLWKGGEMRVEGSMCVRWGPYLKIHSNRFFLITLLRRFLNTLWPKEILNRVTWNKNTSMCVSHATHLYLKMYHESLKYCRSHKSFTTNDLRLGGECLCLSSDDSRTSLWALLSKDEESNSAISHIEKEFLGWVTNSDMAF